MLKGKIESIVLPIKLSSFHDIGIRRIRERRTIRLILTENVLNGERKNVIAR